MAKKKVGQFTTPALQEAGWDWQEPLVEAHSICLKIIHAPLHIKCTLHHRAENMYKLLGLNYANEQESPGNVIYRLYPLYSIAV